MQLKDIVKPLDQMTDDELLDRLRGVRRRRTTERPAAKAREERVERKESRGRLSAIDKLLAGLSDAEREALLQQLGGSNGGSTEGSATGGEEVQ